MCMQAEFSGRRSGVAALTRSYMKRLGIILNHGPPWVEHRRFALKQLRNFGLGKNTMESIIHGELQKLFGELDAIEGSPMAVNSRFNLPVLNVLWSIVANFTFDAKDPVSEECVETVKNFFKIAGPQNPIEYFPWLRFIFPDWSGYTAVIKHREFTTYLFHRIIKEHRDTLDPSNPRDFIDTFLIEMESSNSKERQYTDENLCIICMDLFIAGMETTSSTLTWALLFMIMYPDIQAKVQKEIDSVVDRDSFPTGDNKQLLPYTQATILEILRRSALVPRGVFHTALDDTKFRGYDIPRGTIMITHLQHVLLNEKHWVDSDKFMPERFLNSNGMVVSDSHLIPFGIGRRSCLGESLARQELFYFFTALMQRYVFTPVNRELLSMESNKGVVAQPLPFDVRFRKRISQ